MNPNENKRPSRKKRDEPKNKEEVKNDLKARFREKMERLKLNRTKQEILDREIEDIEDKLEGKNLKAKEKKKLKERLKLLEEIEENRINSINDDCAEYVDGASYGGGAEHPD